MSCRAAGATRFTTSSPAAAIAGSASTTPAHCPSPATASASWTNGSRLGFLAPLLHFDAQPLDLLVQRGERHLEFFRRLGLVTFAFLQHVGDDAALDVFHDLEERGVTAMVEHARAAAAGDVVRQQLAADARPRR